MRITVFYPVSGAIFLSGDSGTAAGCAHFHVVECSCRRAALHLLDPETEEGQSCKDDILTKYYRNGSGSDPLSSDEFLF